jgi:hypothetical protein
VRCKNSGAHAPPTASSQSKRGRPAPVLGGSSASFSEGADWCPPLIARSLKGLSKKVFTVELRSERKEVYELAGSGHARPRCLREKNVVYPSIYELYLLRVYRKLRRRGLRGRQTVKAIGCLSYACSTRSFCVIQARRAMSPSEHSYSSCSSLE